MKEILKSDAAIARLLLPQKLLRGIRYIPSQFVLPFTHRGKPYAFHLLTKQCLETKLPEAAYPGEGFDPLIEAMFLIPEGKDECDFYQSFSSMMRLYAQVKGTSNYTIMPTLACNARCIYCFEKGSKPVTMTPKVVEQCIRYIINTRADTNLVLNWFGGEPLLFPDIIDQICEELTRKNILYHSNIITNGSLITTTILNKMMNKWMLNRIQVSMDGAEPDYLARKQFTTENNQYHTVIKAIDLMSKTGITVMIRCNVDEDNIEGLPIFLDDLSYNISNKQNVMIYFSPLLDIRAGANDLSFWKKLLKTSPLIESAGFRRIEFGGASVKFHTNRCKADGGGIVIGPDGSLFPCDRCPTDSCYGNIFDGITNESARKEFCRTDQVREKCSHCTFLPDCTSFASCPWHVTHCREVKELITIDSLKRMIERNSGNITPNENVFIC